MSLSVNIIGAGRLGKTIGHLLVKNQLVTIGFICNRSEASAIDAIKFIGQGDYCLTVSELPPADITFITTPDELIPTTCEEFSNNFFIKEGSTVIHCSGLLTSDALASIKARGCYVASVHPMRSFAKPELSTQLYRGTYCAIEGDNESIPLIQSLFNSIGSITYEIDKRKKSLYHAAGVFASNYLVTLAEQSLSCMRQVGIENEQAMHSITSIMHSTVTNLEKTLSPKQSLTGPIKRGDVSTILKHLESFTDAEQKRLYCALGKATLPLTDSNIEKMEIAFNEVNYDGKV